MTDNPRGSSIRSTHLAPAAPGPETVAAAPRSGTLGGRAVRVPGAPGNRDSQATFPPPPPPSNAEHDTTGRSVTEDVAHDLTNMLLVLDCELDNLAGEPLSAGGAESLSSMRTQTSYLRFLARELREAGAAPRPADQRTVLSAWWPDVAALLHAVHRDDIVVRADVPIDLPMVRIAPSHLTQAILNIASNAAHAIAERASRTGYGELPIDASPAAEVRVSARAGGHGGVVYLEITDNGPGMSPAILARACEPLFTTRAGRGGTGLGLRIVQRLISRVGGAVHLCSAVGAGTTVTLELPTCAIPCAEQTSG